MTYHQSIHRNVEVTVHDLLITVKRNKENHIATYNETVENYQKYAQHKLDEEYTKAQQKLKEAYSRAKNEIVNFDPKTAKDTIVFCEPISFTLDAPRTHENEYEQAIQMLEWEKRPNIELTAGEFRNFVMDEWDWKQKFLVDNQFYTSGCMNIS